MKVLVVDDDVDLLDLMTYALRREGYNVLAAVDGQQALQRWESENPDIVLLDGNLPKIVGFEVCRRIRHDSRLIGKAWGYYDEGNSNLLKTHICHIRKKLALSPTGKRGIKAVLGVGYSLTRT